MTTLEQIKEVRLSTHDPIGYIDIVSVATDLLLPATPVPQTLYLVVATGEYKAYIDAVWTRVSIGMSDARMSGLIDLYGIKRACVKVLREFISSLGKAVPLARFANGTESFEYQSLKDRYDYYKELIASFEDEALVEEGSNTGRYAKTKKYLVGGM